MARRGTISEIIQKYSDVQQILSVLASADVFKLFLYADRGLLLSVPFLRELQMSIKQYYKALHRLKMLGLLEKKMVFTIILFRVVFCINGISNKLLNCPSTRKD
jgi:hypothetical protein